MLRRDQAVWVSAVALTAIGLCGITRNARGDADVSGVVSMPDVCSPSVSPAVVYLSRVALAGEPRLAKTPTVAAPAGQSRVADLVLVNQRGLQFVPRVQAIRARADRAVHQPG